MRRLTLALPGNEELAHSLAQACGSEVGGIEIRRFPDGESYVRLHGDPLGRPVDLVCTLARPDPQFLSLVFAADAARELGASEVNLVAPYLAYMRQDKRFQEGESVTSLSFARLVSSTFDKLLTVDPHLHRHPTLSAVYTIPTKALHAAPLLADWIVQHVEKPLVVGPDEESEQWAGAIAARIGDIASSGRTLIMAAHKLVEQGMRRPECVVVHALFAEDAWTQLAPLFFRITSTDAVPHASNRIALAPLFAQALLSGQTDPCG